MKPTQEYIDIITAIFKEAEQRINDKKSYIGTGDSYIFIDTNGYRVIFQKHENTLEIASCFTDKTDVFIGIGITDETIRIWVEFYVNKLNNQPKP